MEGSGLDLGGERSPRRAVSLKGHFRARPTVGTTYLSAAPGRPRAADSSFAARSKDAQDMPHLTVTLPTPPRPAQSRKLRGEGDMTEVASSERRLPSRLQETSFFSRAQVLAIPGRQRSREAPRSGLAAGHSHLRIGRADL